MTNPQMEEIYRLSERALQQGQQFIPVHVFPFRMTDTNLAAHADSEWQPFWRNIKDAYDVFERTRVPPSVQVCGKKYVVREGMVPGGIQTASAGADTGADCVDTAPDPSQQTMLPDDDAEPARVIKSRKVVSKTQRRRSAGRNARKAYAEARKSRMAAHAAAPSKHRRRRLRASSAGVRSSSGLSAASTVHFNLSRRRYSSAGERDDRRSCRTSAP